VHKSKVVLPDRERQFLVDTIPTEKFRTCEPNLTEADWVKWPSAGWRSNGWSKLHIGRGTVTICGIDLTYLPADSLVVHPATRGPNGTCKKCLNIASIWVNWED
jgi:hypothetical protein